MVGAINNFSKKLKAPFQVPQFLDKKHFPSLDGWRAIAIIMVILGHCKATVSSHSYYYKFAEIFIYAQLGVQIFFVLSGFLITSLLIKEYIAFKKINFLLFFLKRAIRILPVLYLYLFVILAVDYYFELGLLLDYFLGPMLYLTNFSAFQSTWLTGHTWSLAVEQQYYLIWPMLFSITLKKSWLVCFSSIIIVPVLRILYYFHPEYYEPTLGAFITYVDAIFMGSLFAIFSFKGLFNKLQIWEISGLDFVASLVTFIFAYCSHRGIAGVIALPFSGTICNLMISFLMLRTIINSKSILFKILNNKQIIQIGLISYSLYIWQQLFIIPTNLYSGKLEALSFPFNILAALITAYVSYNFYEILFVKLKAKHLIKLSN